MRCSDTLTKGFFDHIGLDTIQDSSGLLVSIGRAHFRENNGKFTAQLKDTVSNEYIPISFSTYLEFCRIYRTFTGKRVNLTIECNELLPSLELPFPGNALIHNYKARITFRRDDLRGWTRHSIDDSNPNFIGVILPMLSSHGVTSMLVHIDPV